jgi:hypothetical protein
LRTLNGAVGGSARNDVCDRFLSNPLAARVRKTAYTRQTRDVRPRARIGR